MLWFGVKVQLISSKKGMKLASSNPLCHVAASAPQNDETRFSMQSMSVLACLNWGNVKRCYKSELTNKHIIFY